MGVRPDMEPTLSAAAERPSAAVGRQSSPGASAGPARRQRLDLLDFRVTCHPKFVSESDLVAVKNVE